MLLSRTCFVKHLDKGKVRKGRAGATAFKRSLKLLAHPEKRKPFRKSQRLWQEE